MRHLNFVVPGKAVPQGSVRAFLPKNSTRPIVIHDKSAELREYRSRVAMAAQDVGAHPLDGPIEMTVTFVLPRPKAHYGTGKNSHSVKPSAPEYPETRPDVDKVGRAVLDALTQVCYHDDSQVVSLNLSKAYVTNGEAPRTCIEVAPVRAAS